MKELKYNAVEEWRAHYINYAAFKRLIYGEEKRKFGDNERMVPGATPFWTACQGGSAGRQVKPRSDLTP